MFRGTPKREQVVVFGHSHGNVAFLHLRMTQLLRSDTLALGNIIEPFVGLCVQHGRWSDTHTGDLLKQTVVATFVRGERDVFVQHLPVHIAFVVFQLPRISLGIRCRRSVILERYSIHVSDEESSND